MKSFFTSSRPSALDVLRDDVRKLGKDAAQVGREQLVTPAMTLVHEAQQTFEENVASVRKSFGPQIERTRRILEKDCAKAQDIATRQYQRAWAWIAANPFTAVGVALTAGIVLNSMGRRPRG